MERTNKRVYCLECQFFGIPSSHSENSMIKDATLNELFKEQFVWHSYSSHYFDHHFHIDKYREE